MNHGELIRKLRLERGITQEQLCHKITSRTALTNLEKQNSRISFEILLQYLSRMNIRLDEYYLMYTDHESREKRSISLALPHIYASGDTAIQKDLEKYKEKYNETKDLFFYFVYIQLSILKMKKNGDFNSSYLSNEIEFLKGYLDRVETWGRFEIALFSNSLFLFPDDFIEEIFDRVISKLLRLQDEPIFSKDLTLFLINCLSLSFERNNIEFIRVVLPYLLKQCKSEKELYEKTMYLFFLGLLDCTAGNAQGKEKMDRALLIFRSLDETAKARSLEQFVERVMRDNGYTIKQA
ncbi:Helix-turn-helix domain protein [compost metagenome]